MNTFFGSLQHVFATANKIQMLWGIIYSEVKSDIGSIIKYNCSTIILDVIAELRCSKCCCVISSFRQSIMTEFTHNGKEYRVTDKQYQKYVRFWCKTANLRIFCKKVKLRAKRMIHAK